MNFVSHYKRGSSNKIYIVSIRTLPSGKYQVVARWGKRHASRFQSIVKGEFSDYTVAMTLANKLESEKLKKGYVSITSREYDDDVTFEELSPWIEGPTSVQTVTPDRVEPEVVHSIHKSVLRCINNLGIEHLFDVGAEYNGKSSHDDELILVVDNNGNQTEVFRERFESVR